MEEKNTLTEEQIEKEEARKNGDSAESQEKAEQDEKKQKKAASTKKSKTDELKKENEHLKKELEEIKDNYLRLSAEFQNLRKRFEKEKEDIVLHANEKLMEMILPIIDDFERSLSVSDKNNSFEDFRNGIDLIYKNFLEVLEKEGVKPIKAVGEEFDHNLHDALMMTETDKAKSGMVVEEVMKGYFYKDKILRHSKVIVAK